jgi:chorismate synthase
MNANTFGRLFSFSSFGESHGPAVGCLIDGCPARLPLAEDDIQPFLNRRRPGQNKFVTPRQEEDRVSILSGVYDGMTTGTPILLLVENKTQRSGDYDKLKDVFRPGHADAAYQAKYGIRDPRGGGRASARETVARVAAGAVAKKLLSSFADMAQVRVSAALTRLGGVETTQWDESVIHENPFFCADPGALPAMADAITKAMETKTSLGGIVEIRAQNVPPGLGEPVYDRLDGRIGSAILGLNAVKGVEIGDGFAASLADGAVNNDRMRTPRSGRLADSFVTNHAGGILGGISTGQEIVVRAAVKPTPSIAAVQQTVDKDLNDVDIEIGGRHDPAVCIRAVPVLEATLWHILADFFLLQRARNR